VELSGANVGDYFRPSSVFDRFVFPIVFNPASANSLIAADLRGFGSCRSIHALISPISASENVVVT
jgi:hypothetical protein